MLRDTPIWVWILLPSIVVAIVGFITGWQYHREEEEQE